MTPATRTRLDGSEDTTPAVRRSRLRRSLAFIHPYRVRAGLVLLLAILLAALNALDPLVLKWIVDSLEQGPWSVVLQGLVLLLVLSIVREAVGSGANWLVWRVRLGVHQALLHAVLNKLHTLPVHFHRRESVGGLLTKVDRSISGFLQAVQELGQDLIPSLVYLIISLWIMLSLDWRLTLVVLAFTPLPVLVTRWAAPEQLRRERQLLDRWVSLYSRFNEVLTGIVTVRSFVMEEEEKRRFLRGVDEANRTVIRGVARDSGTGAAKNFAAALGRVAAIAMGGVRVYRGEITLGTLVAFLGYVGGIFGPVQGITSVYATLRRASVSLDVLFGLLDAPEELGDAPDAVPLERVEGRVEFEDVHFGYRTELPVLKGIDLAIAPRERVALVGPSGSGKSTMLALLQRLYDPDRGVVRVDGHDIRKVRQKDLRRHIGTVLQEPLLFQDSVQANIAYGKPDASLAEVEAAARAANAHDFISRLPDGYETLVGERGSLLSVGERQRVAIARALLRDPAILLLDEPTAALDVETERLVQQALNTLMRDRTTIVIAHRLSTVVGMDRIVVLRDGRIVESGSHRELLAAGGYYASLVRSQVEDLLPERAEEIFGWT